jgi:hypothetical protein
MLTALLRWGKIKRGTQMKILTITYTEKYDDFQTYRIYIGTDESPSVDEMFDFLKEKFPSFEFEEHIANTDFWMENTDYSIQAEIAEFLVQHMYTIYEPRSIFLES